MSWKDFKSLFLPIFVVALELNEEYAAMARRRIEDDAPLFHGRTA